MANPDLPLNALQKPLPRALAKAKQRRAANADLVQAYADVDLRDGPQSRISGRWTVAGAVDPRQRREHDHIRPRSTHPELVADPRNIFVCTAEEHQLIHAGAIEVEGTNANKELRFHWNRKLVPAGKEPFEIKQHRRKA
jgi:hypothetical protein